MRFVVVATTMDPNDERFFSGTSRHIIMNLRRLGHQVTTIGPAPPRGLPPIQGLPPGEWIKTRFYRHALGKYYQPGRNPALLRARARHANAQLRGHNDADAVIVFYPPHAAYLETAAPLVCIHDSTFHLLVDYYPQHDRSQLPRETLAGGYALDRLAFAKCDLVIQSSQWAADSAIREGGADPRKVMVANFGANLVTLPAPSDVERSIDGRGHEPCRLLFIGYDWQRKRGDIAVAAARSLRQQGIPTELGVIGGRPTAEGVDFVKWHGLLSKKIPTEAALIDQLLSEADFLIHPARAECYGMVLCEAAVHGVPVVTTDAGGIPSIVRDESWGAALPVDAPGEAYAAWIARAYRDRARYGALARAARRNYEERLNWDVFVQLLCAAVEKLPRRQSRHVAAAKSAGQNPLLARGRLESA